ncbi:hypothetical protein [Dongia sp.]|uniref:hypothetical protein n=1 Tax=Dongia sp. TaxID=1977262 RepID=UPI0035B404C2
MPSLRNSAVSVFSGKVTTLVFALAAIVYPLAVYWMHERVSFTVFALVAIFLLLARSFFVREGVMRLLRLPLLVAAFLLAALALFDAAAAAKAYPAMVSLLVAILFGNSLRHPPSLVERFARLRDAHLGDAATLYCRRVTLVWTVWLAMNAGVAAILAWDGDVALWALWTSLISYAVSGALFFGEMLLRRWLIARAEA